MAAPFADLSPSPEPGSGTPIVVRVVRRFRPAGRETEEVLIVTSPTLRLERVLFALGVMGGRGFISCGGKERRDAAVVHCWGSLGRVEARLAARAGFLEVELFGEGDINSGPASLTRVAIPPGGFIKLEVDAFDGRRRAPSSD